MKCAIVCDTAYQLYNAIRIKMIDYKNDSMDLFVVNQFFQAEVLSERVIKEKIFNNVYILPNGNKEGNYYRRDIDFYNSKIKEIVLPQRLLQEWTNTKLFFDDYDILFFSLFMRTHIMLRMLNPKAKVYFFDDGTGSYNGAIFPYGFKLHKLSFTLQHGLHKLDLNVNTIYLNYPEMATYKDIKIAKIKDDFSITPLLKAVFDPENIGSEVYKGKKFVYLTEPNDTNIYNYLDKENKVIDILDCYTCNTVIRPHPRLNKTEYENTHIIVDTSQLLWEYLIKSMCIENIVLISDYSTAQITPKLLFGEEPYLIFLFLIMGYDKSFTDLWMLDVQKIKSVYKTPSKIFVPNTIDELRRIIDVLSEG